MALHLLVRRFFFFHILNKKNKDDIFIFASLEAIFSSLSLFIFVCSLIFAS